MEKFVASIRRKYRERRIQCEEQWPPVRGDRLINLQLVEAEKEEGFRAGLLQLGAVNDENKITVKRTPILYGDLFNSDSGKKPVSKIIVEGNAGMGKTTLCTMLAEGWAEGKILKQFDCVLLLPLRNSRVSSATSLPELFKLFHASERIRAAVVEDLEEKEGEGVLIIADGWDELSKENQSNISFLYDLLFGGILPFASVLLTSRPSASAPLHNISSIDCLVEVVGFNEENVKQYIQSAFEKVPEKALSLIEEIENNLVIQSVCSVPLNCAIVCHLWHTLDQSLPRTLTELYTKIVLNIVFRNIKKKFSIGRSLNSFDEIPDDLQNTFWLICEFAYECLLLDQLVFSESELATRLTDVGEKLHCFGLLQSAESLLPVGHGLSFHFAHLTIQEYLAALHLATLSNEKKLEVIEYAYSNRFDMVWRFVFGLGSKSTGNASEKVITLNEAVFDHLVHCRRDTVTLQCNLAFESLHPLFSTMLCNTHKTDLLYVVSITPFDCVAYFHVLRHMTQCNEMIIIMFDCGLTDKLLKELIDILASGMLKILHFNLSHNKLTSKGVADLFERAYSSLSTIKSLYLVSNNITNVKSILSLPFKHLDELHLSNNPLGVDGIQSFETAVRAGVLINLSTLHLSNTLTDDADINEALLTTLLPSLAFHCPQVKCLNISDNNLRVQGLFTVMENISSQLNILKLANTLIAEICPSEPLDLQLQRCESSVCVDFVNLSGCNFNGGRYLVLAKFMMRSLKTLFCFNCCLTSADIIALMNYLKIANVVCENLTYWDLSNNDIGKEGVSALTENIPELFPKLNFAMVVLHGNLVSEKFLLMCNKQLKAFYESLETAVLSEWSRTCLPPTNKKMTRVFYEWWDELLILMINQAIKLQVFFPSTKYRDSFSMYEPLNSIAEVVPSVESTCSTVHTAATLTTEQENTAEVVPSVESACSTVHTAATLTTEQEKVSVFVSAADLDQEESVTPVVLSTPPTIPTHSADDVILTMEQEDMILKVLKKARDKYYFIGKGIGLDDADLKEIETSHHPDKIRCLHEMLKLRIQQGGLTRSKLCESLRGELVERNDVALEIEALDLCNYNQVQFRNICSNSMHS